MIKIGRYVNTHGLKGEIKLISNFSKKNLVFKKNTKIFIDDKEFIIESYRPHKIFDMLVLKDVNNINDIEFLKNNDVYTLREYLNVDYLVEDFLSYTAIDNNKNYKIIEIIENKLYKIIKLDNNKLIPINDVFIEKVDSENKKIYIKEGFIMKIDILTLFPKMFENFLNESIIKRAIDNNIVKINVSNLRNYSTSKHKKVDDTPYGGGPGMLLKCQPVFDAIKDLKKTKTKVILTSPSGIKYNQKIAENLSKEKHLILICGHYEGFDERIKTLCDIELSIGDYVLTGGELPSMVITDSIVRLLDDAINEESKTDDSFSNDLLEHPQYTKPKEYENLKVPEVLLSGDHKEIKKWRLEKSIEKTEKLRPELLKNKFVLINKNYFKKGILNLIENPYSFNPKNNAKSDKFINIKKMEVYNSYFVEIIVKKNIEKRFQNLLKLVLESDDENDDDTKIIDEAAKLKSIMKTKYTKILKEEYIEIELKRIDFILTKIRKRSKINEKEQIKEERVR